jgi:hypothetical protein
MKGPFKYGILIIILFLSLRYFTSKKKKKNILIMNKFRKYSRKHNPILRSIPE